MSSVSFPSSPLRRVARLALVGTLAVASLSVVATASTGGRPAQAATAAVSNLGEGAGSLRTFVSLANTNPTVNRIELPTSGPYTLETCGEFEDFNATGDIDIVRAAPLTIVGTAGSPAVIRQTCTDRVFDVRGSGAVRFENVVVERGNLPVRTIFSTRAANEFDGGGIRTLTANLILVDTTVQLNSAATSGSAVAGFSSAQPGGNGGGIWSGSGFVTLEGSTVSRNGAGEGGRGDGLGNNPGNGGNGGGIYSAGGIVELEQSTVMENGAGDGGDASGGEDGGAGGSGGGIWSAGSVTIVDSSVVRNSAGEGGASSSAIAGSDGGDGGDGGGVVVTGTSGLGSGGSEIRENNAGDGGGAVNGVGGIGGDGGGIWAADVSGSMVSYVRNRAGHGGDSTFIAGGRGGDGGAIAADTVDLASSALTENSAGRGGDSGTGLFGVRGGDGGAIAVLDSAALADIVAIRNSAGTGSDGTESGGDGGDGGVLAVYFGPSGRAPTYTIERSTFWQNSAGRGGNGPTAATGGDGGWGGVAYTVQSVRGAFDAVNSIFVENSAGSSTTASGTGNGAVAAVGNVTMRYSTVVDNLRGTAITNARTGLASFDRISASVFGDNDGGNCDLAANQSGGYNREHGGDTCFFNDPTDAVSRLSTGLEPTDTTGTAPRVVPIAGGQLDGLIPAAACSSGFLSGVSTDHDGAARPGGPGCEPGATEIGGAAPPPPTPPVLPTGSELDQATRFFPVNPVRLFDTRESELAPGPKGRLTAGETIDVQVAGGSIVPSDASAVVLNLTVTGTTGRTFVTAFPTGEERPTASNVNIVSAGQVRPNLVTVPVGSGGGISFFSANSAHLVADIAGYYLDIDTSSAGGRFIPLAPQRLFDSRPTEPGPGPKGKLTAGQTVDLDIDGFSGFVRPAEIAAIVVNITGAQADGRGFLTAWPKGIARPTASNVNLSSRGATAPNLAIVPLGADGDISVYSSSGAHLIVDVTGYITNDVAPASTAGLFVPLNPTRLFDSRPAEPAPGPKGVIASESTFVGKVADVGGIPATATAVSLNVTGIQAPQGFVTAFPFGTSRPTASLLNFAGASDTRANAAMLPVGDGGRISLYLRSGGHLLADTAGYFTSEI
ncbi:MAG: hypothetical protein AB8G14_05790 [Ilumatobacter sp.]